MNRHSREQTPVQYSEAAIRVLHFTVQPLGLCFRAHWHDRIELLRILKGEMTVDIGTDVIRATADQLVIIPPGTLHRGIAGSTAVQYDVLMFDLRTFYNGTVVCRRLLPALYDGTASLQHITDHAQTIRCADALCHQLDQNSLACTAMVYQLLSELFANSVLSINRQKKPDIIREITAYIEDNFTQDIDTAALCHRFGYTAAHLCRKFKAAIGLTPMNYLKIYRLEQARKQIVGSHHSIGEIAARCGFADANYFTRCFTAHFGNPPTHFRNK